MPEVDAFLASETFAGRAGPSNRAEARRALQFLYEEVLHRRWPRRSLSAAGQRWKAKKAVYLNGQQKDVKLLDRMRNAMRVGQYALDTEKAYVEWARKYILFHQKRHPQEMGALEVEQFLTYLPVASQRRGLGPASTGGARRQGQPGPRDRVAAAAGGAATAAN